jgi:hypothetical protein
LHRLDYSDGVLVLGGRRLPRIMPRLTDAVDIGFYKVRVLLPLTRMRSISGTWIGFQYTLQPYCVPRMCVHEFLNLWPEGLSCTRTGALSAPLMALTVERQFKEFRLSFSRIPNGKRRDVLMRLPCSSGNPETSDRCPRFCSNHELEYCMCRCGSTQLIGSD